MDTIKHFSTDIVIIGAGPVGLFMAFEAGMLNMKCHIIDTLDMVGGQCSALYPEKPIYDIPGFPKIEAQSLIDSLYIQASPFNPTYHLQQRVETLKKQNDNFIITTTKGTTIESKAVVIAAGCGAFGPNKPPLEHIEQYENKSIFYMVKKKSDFKDKRIVIAGGGDSAVDWAISLSEVAKKIIVVHRRPKFRCAPDSYEKLKSLNEIGVIDLVIPYQLDSIKGKNGLLEEVIVEDLDNNKISIEADILLPFFGLSMQLGPIAEWNLELANHHILVNQSSMATNINGVFAIGDICIYKNKLKLILTGFAEAATAAHSIRNIVHPNEAFHFEHSTTKGIKQE
jgi:thioredoxin reductase (NADPH)